MWLTSDSCPASPITSSYSWQGSPPAQELGGEMVLTGPGEKGRGGEGRGAGSALQASEDVATLPTRGH